MNVADPHDLRRALEAKGFRVTAVVPEPETGRLLIGFNFMPHRVAPSWLKAFEVGVDATPEDVERQVEVWRARVRDDLARAHPSSTVRELIAAHGRQAVIQAMGPERQRSDREAEGRTGGERPS